MAVKVDRDVAELEFSNKHGRRLHQAQPSLVEEDILVLFGVFDNCFVEHDEEAESKGNDEKAIPSEEEEECLEDPEEHGDVDVVLLQLRMSTNENNQLAP